MSRLNFKLEAQATGSRARASTFQTLHGEVKTPIFMPVGTQATVKSQTVDSLKSVGSNVLLANTYHLLLRPGPEVFQKFGGIHRFMNWDKPVLTDSGGFQIFSLPHSRNMNEEGARFQSYIDGKMILLSPEVSIQTQRAIGSDIMMVLDQCIPSTAERAQAVSAMELTHRWAKRSLEARGDSLQSIFGIVQGACFQDLRKQSAAVLTEMPFDGFAVGGLAVGESKQEREDFTELTAALLPANLPRYLMGVGTPLDILEAVHRGIDMFDCILPSQLAQRGTAFTSQGKFQLRRSVYKFDEAKLDPDCNCNTCQVYSRAYLHHLNKADEVLGWHLIALHNLTFYHRLMSEMREAILNDTFLAYYKMKREELARTDEENPSTPLRQPKLSRFEKQKTLGDYEVHVSPKGFCSIKQISSGEIMHSVNPPAEEARNLYVTPSRLGNRFKDKNEIVIWDVGLGAGSNAMEVIREALTILPEYSDRKLRVVSFEIDLDPFKLALKHPSHFPHLQHAAPHALLDLKKWQSEDEKIEWHLFEGDFLAHFETAPKPDVIFYDPFSLKTDSKLWTTETFQRIRNYLNEHPAKLMTYSSSTEIRAALLSEGFFVGKGMSTGSIADTTEAYTHRDLAEREGNLLGADWLQRWNRSQSKFPNGLALGDQEEFEKKIKSHAQFLIAE
jgi:queuine tRNA-ribosyltransferase